MRNSVVLCVLVAAWWLVNASPRASLLAKSRAARAAAASHLPRPAPVPSVEPVPEVVDVGPKDDLERRFAEFVELSDGGFLGKYGIQKMLVFPSFLTPVEAETLANLTEKRHLLAMQGDSLVVGEEGADVETRRSHTMFLNSDLELDDPVIAGILGRLHSVTAMADQNGESLQLTRYNEARKHRYTLHMDSSLLMSRPATALLYLRTLRPGDGGSTVFPLTRLSAAGARTLRWVRAKQLAALGLESDASFLRRQANTTIDSNSSSIDLDDRDGGEQPRGRIGEVSEAPPSNNQRVNILRRACREDTADRWAHRVKERLLLHDDEGDAMGRLVEEELEGLDSVREGGALLLRPVQGMMVFWRNHDSIGRLDWRTKHGACELEPLDASNASSPARRPKLIAQRWFNWRGQRQRSPSGGVVEEQEVDTLSDTLRSCLDHRMWREELGMPPAPSPPPGEPVPFVEMAWSTNPVEQWE